MTGPSFRFRLERVRAVRERKEMLAQQELAKSLQRMSGTQAQLRSTEADLEQAQAEQRTMASEPGIVDAAELQARQAFMESVEARRSRQALDLIQTEAEVAERNAMLVTAAGEHEMLNRLRDRRRGEHDRETSLTENKLLDEMAGARAQRSLA